MNKSLMGVILFFVAIIGIGLLGYLLWFIPGYNKAISLDEGVKSAWAQVENQLQRRNDLIPNLVNTVKGYAAQEKEIFTEVTRLRSQWGKAQSVGEKIENAGAMSNVLSRLLVVSENYPQLKSNENFLALQSQLEGTENRISVERRRYNKSVEEFNRFQRKFFGRFFARKAGVDKPAEYFKATEAAQQVPQVEF
ncbi:MAG: LemA family protein [Candidatus Omnitrophica bacterium]|nr:LemA family protein [Candidatus Omnitrophota bacterium]